MCGLDGNSYCSAEMGSSAFDGFWKACASSPGGNRNPRVTAVVKTYWMYYYTYYVQVISAPECVLGLVWEFQILSDLEMYLKNSFARGVAVVLGVWSL